MELHSLHNPVNLILMGLVVVLVMAAFKTSKTYGRVRVWRLIVFGIGMAHFTRVVILLLVCLVTPPGKDEISAILVSFMYAFILCPLGLWLIAGRPSFYRRPE